MKFDTLYHKESKVIELISNNRVLIKCIGEKKTGFYEFNH